MKLFSKMKDGGPESKVWGYFLIEWKRVFSIVLLRFEDGTREAYHSHAFNALSWVLKGQLFEGIFNGNLNVYNPSLLPIYTSRETTHMVRSAGRTWVLSFRGPWADTWQEYVDGKLITLTNGRKVVDATTQEPT